jgi:tetratricopeptide (TPR) repeat protein
MRRIAATLLLWPLLTGAFYEWGGDAARGVRELKEGNAREALEALRRGRAELPRSAAVRYDQGLAYGGLGLADSAAAAYRDAARSPELQGDPARSSAAFNLGNQFMGANRFGEAARLYRESLRLDPTRVDAKKNLEEAIRRLRSEKQKPPQGGGGRGSQPQGTGSTGRQGQPPPQEQPGGAPERRDAGRSPQLGNPIPSRSEAEHWLDALESERRAARMRDERGSPKEEGKRDW